MMPTAAARNEQQIRERWRSETTTQRCNTQNTGPIAWTQCNRAERSYKDDFGNQTKSSRGPQKSLTQPSHSREQEARQAGIGDIGDKHPGNASASRYLHLCA